jgi:hypothetical protein
MKNYDFIQLVLACFLNMSLAREYLLCSDVCQSSPVLLDIQLLPACKCLLRVLPSCAKINTQRQAHGTGGTRSVF